jgi:galactonate dehydratase
MKVVKAEIFELSVPVTPALYPVIVRLTTDEGITGVGEASIGWGTGHTAAAGMVKNLVESFVIGADPTNTEKLWETMFRSSFWGLGGGPIVYAGMSAIDIACWDIKGKSMKQPIWRLLGGKTNSSIRAYASHLQDGWGPEFKIVATPEAYAEEARKAIAAGFDAVKINPVYWDVTGTPSTNTNKILSSDDVKLFYDRVKAVREAVGPKVAVILDTFGLLSDTTAIQMDRVWE